MVLKHDIYKNIKLKHEVYLNTIHTKETKYLIKIQKSKHRLYGLLPKGEYGEVEYNVKTCLKYM